MSTIAGGLRCLTNMSDKHNVTSCIREAERTKCKPLNAQHLGNKRGKCSNERVKMPYVQLKSKTKKMIAKISWPIRHWCSPQ